jgi:hypothetical protein
MFEYLGGERFGRVGRFWQHGGVFSETATGLAPR